LAVNTTLHISVAPKYRILNWQVTLFLKLHIRRLKCMLLLFRHFSTKNPQLFLKIVEIKELAVVYDLS